VELSRGEDLSAATFVVTGEPGLAYSIQVPQAASYTLTNGMEEMIIENFTSSLRQWGLLAEGKSGIQYWSHFKCKGRDKLRGYYTSPSPMDVTVVFKLTSTLQYSLVF
jgi:hypothetical protein